MPLVSFKPTKARLVIEDGKDSVLVMKVTVAKGETVELATGGRLEALSGVLRIRERKANGARGNGAIGSLIFIEESGRGADFSPAKFQINLGMAADKFEPLLARRAFRAAAQQVLRRRRRARVRARDARAVLRAAARRADQGLGHDVVPDAARDQLRDDPSDRRARAEGERRAGPSRHPSRSNRWRPTRRSPSSSTTCSSSRARRATCSTR